MMYSWLSTRVAASLGNEWGLCFRRGGPPPPPPPMVSFCLELGLCVFLSEMSPRSHLLNSSMDGMHATMMPALNSAMAASQLLAPSPVVVSVGLEYPRWDEGSAGGGLQIGSGLL